MIFKIIILLLVILLIVLTYYNSKNIYENIGSISKIAVKNYTFDPQVFDPIIENKSNSYIVSGKIMYGSSYNQRSTYKYKPEGDGIDDSVLLDTAIKERDQA